MSDYTHQNIHDANCNRYSGGKIDISCVYVKVKPFLPYWNIGRGQEHPVYHLLWLHMGSPCDQAFGPLAIHTVGSTVPSATAGVSDSHLGQLSQDGLTSHWWIPVNSIEYDHFCKNWPRLHVELPLIFPHNFYNTVKIRMQYIYIYIPCASWPWNFPGFCSKTWFLSDHGSKTRVLM